MDLEYMHISYPNILLNMRDGSKLRGYFAKKYIDEEIVHNHRDNAFVYKYPQIQFKIIDRSPLIIGIGSLGINFLESKRIFFEKELIISNDTNDITEVNVHKDVDHFGTTDKILKYQFKTPWMALNAKNSEIYKNSDEIDREELLKRVLIGNILSMSKSLGYNIEEKLKVKINLKEVPVKFKNQNMAGFRGEFYINFDIPQYLGIGRNVSRGFGTVLKV